MSVETLFGGWPFLDREFQIDRLNAAVAVVRGRIANGLGFAECPSNYLLSPEIAKVIRAEEYSFEEIVSRDLSALEREKLDKAILYIVQKHKHWRAFLEALVFRHAIRNNVISCSSFAYPQHTFLGSKAFDSLHNLAEQVVHEACHVWAYMIEEIEPFDIKSGPKVYTLPSGTGSKNPTEVLGAAYVAAVLIKFYKKIEEEDLSVPRVPTLKKYLAGCLLIIRDYHSFSWSGLELLSKLNFFIETMEQKND